MSTSWYPLNKPSTGRAFFGLEDQDWSQRYNPKADLPPNFLTLPHRQAGSLLICRCTFGLTLLPPCLPRHDTVASRPRHPGRWRYVTARLCTAGRPRFTCLRPASFPILIYRPTIPASAASPPAACRIQPVAEDSNTLYHPVSQLPSMLNELVRDHRARRRAQEIGKDESSSVRTTPDRADRAWLAFCKRESCYSWAW